MNFLTDTIADKLSEAIQSTQKNAFRHLALAEKWRLLHQDSTSSKSRTFCSKLIASHMLDADLYFTRMRELQVLRSLRKRR